MGTQAVLVRTTFLEAFLTHSCANVRGFKPSRPIHSASSLPVCPFTRAGRYGQGRYKRNARTFQSRMSSIVSAVAAGQGLEHEIDRSSSDASGKVVAEVLLEKVQVQVLDRWITIVQPKDLDAVLDMYVEQGRLDRDPYWCRLWSSAIALSEQILDQEGTFAGKEVCDLGAGLGLAGLSASLVGAKEVTLYDREPLALHCALMTAAANGVHVGPGGAFAPSLLFSDSLPPSPEIMEHPNPSPDKASLVQPNHGNYADSNQPRSTLQPRARLPFANKGGPIASNAYIGAGSALKGAIGGSVSVPETGLVEPVGVVTPRGRPQLKAELFDWSDEDFTSPGFDVVLACDVLYEEYSVANVARVITRLLKPQRGSCVLVADPTERIPANRARFIELMEQEHQMKLHRVDRREPVVDNAKQSVEVMQFVCRV